MRSPSIPWTAILTLLVMSAASGEEAPQTPDRTALTREVRSEHFAIRFQPGIDELLAADALVVLERAHDALVEDLGHVPSTPVIVELYPTSAAFSAAAGLPPAAVANETVGLCRYGRLLFTSPAASPFGYPWADTLCHELAHYMVEALGGGNVPVWLHEGIASFAQRRWRGESTPRLDPFAEDLLADAFRDGNLVTLEEIGNCLACLENPERVSLGFAQVHTMVDHLVRAHGIEALWKVLDACGAGASADDAIAGVWPGGFEAFLSSWRRTVEARLTSSDREVGHIALELDGAAEQGQDTLGPDSLLHGTAAEHARLGDLLAARGRTRAAMLEYRTAAAQLDVVSPSLACKEADALQRLGAAQEALHVLREAIELYPGFEPLAIRYAGVLIELGRDEEALDALDEARWLNPFDPRIYAWQAELLQGDAADSAKDRLEDLSKHLR